MGLAKNTGKTVTLNALLAELEREGTTVGVTSVGRDGEEHDVIDARIAKPRVTLPRGSLIATTSLLLRASGVEHEATRRTGMRTPLGEVVIARTTGTGPIEVAGPSGAQDVRAVAEEMRELGAEQVLIDGAIDRRAASSPSVADGLVVSTGAVLGEDLDEVVERTREAIELVRLPGVAEPLAGELRAQAGSTILLDGSGGVQRLAERFVLTADAGQIAHLVESSAGAERLLVAGAVPERFVAELARSLRRAGR